MFSKQRGNPNDSEYALIRKYSTARRVKPLAEAAPDLFKPEIRPARPTRVRVKLRPNREYVYFTDGSLRHAARA